MFSKTKETPGKITKGQPSQLESVESIFVDDYQHYPRGEDQISVSNARKDFNLTYSVSSLHKCWSKMIVDERQVTLKNSETTE